MHYWGRRKENKEGVAKLAAAYEAEWEKDHPEATEEVLKKRRAGWLITAHKAKFRELDEDEQAQEHADAKKIPAMPPPGEER